MSRVLEKRALAPHPTHAPSNLSVGSKLQLVGTDVLKIEFVVVGRIERILLPKSNSAERIDGLWNRTCFEMFMQFGAGESYIEYNFSPSTAWAAYRFESYRDGMSADTKLPMPHIYFDCVGDNGIGRVALTAWLDVSRLLPEHPEKLGLSAVIEEIDGTKSYWALAHPPGKPDFHHPDCFALTLPAFGAA